MKRCEPHDTSYKTFCAACTIENNGWIVKAGPQKCQACGVHGEHDRCTGETTLGTAPCGCVCRRAVAARKSKRWASAEGGAA